MAGPLTQFQTGYPFNDLVTTFGCSEDTIIAPSSITTSFSSIFL
jgi:hypothetical protein